MLGVTVAAACALIVCALAFFLLKRRGPGKHAEERESDAKDGRPVVKICFGTQTGTAEKFAKQVAAGLSNAYGDSTKFVALDMENFEHETELVCQPLLVFLVATYGDGEPTDNAQKFHGWLQEQVAAESNTNLLQGIPFGVFGLGNKQYEHYNAVGKFVHKHLEALGATPIVQLGLGDDDADIADDFESWLNLFLEAVRAADIFEASVSENHVEAPRTGYIARLERDVKAADVEPGSWGSDGHHVVAVGRASVVRELHGGVSDRSCVHVDVDIAGTGVSYQHGDHVAVFAQNSDEVVAEACAVLGLDPEAVLSLELPAGNPEELAEPFPSPVRMGDALRLYCELLAWPDKMMLKVLAQAATDAAEAAKLQRLATHAGKAEYADYVVESKRSLIEVLKDFPSARPSLGVLFGYILPRMRPRYYSISSSPLATPTSLSITAAVVDHATPTGRRHRGVCSSYLASLPVGSRLPLFARTSTFRLPRDAAVPLVMVGPGSGLAPFRGFLQERRALAAAGARLGRAMLFFGCRTPDADYIYKDELESFLQDGTITHLSVAFSRVSTTKDYVQHHITSQASAVYDLVSQQAGYIYVCGDAKHMAKDVHRAFVSVFQKQRQCSLSDAEAEVKSLLSTGRYLQDVW